MKKKVHNRSIKIHHKSMDDYVLTGLYPNEEYYIWVSAKSRRGEGAPTFPLLVSTQKYVPSEPRDMNVLAMNSTTLFVEWKPPIEVQHHRFIDGYQIYVHGEDMGENLLMEQHSNSASNGSSLTYFVTNLQPNSTYRVQVAAKTRKGPGTRCNPKAVKTLGGVPSRPALQIRWKFTEKGFKYEFRLAARNDGGYGQEGFIDIRTPEGPPTGPPTNISFHFITSDTVVLTWDVPEVFHCNGRILGYNLRLYTKLGDHLISEINNLETPKFVMKELAEDTSYYFRISSYTTAGSGPFSERMYWKTIPAIISAPSNVRAATTLEDSLEVWWDEVRLRDIIGYRIYYTMNETIDMDMWMHKDTRSTYSAELQNLKIYQRYYIRVAARGKEVGMLFSSLKSYAEYNGYLGKQSKMIVVKVNQEDVPTNVYIRKKYEEYSTTAIMWEYPIAFQPIEYKV
ncbi:unnamed protein product [Darwinula stevensoni]|uniref:Fibronectin type-III domain-containing protein n=1 Tax=Darwinula stevensoni TaxID=69355 RepID=A0A7R8X4Q5_9CRUS|nr:unnamed protein product [Darwinula stevensoni]CAG0885410.1 unnamed protein product [Darwinula stevensoni]